LEKETTGLCRVERNPRKTKGLAPPGKKRLRCDYVGSDDSAHEKKKLPAGGRERESIKDMPGKNRPAIPSREKDV